LKKVVKTSGRSGTKSAIAMRLLYIVLGMYVLVLTYFPESKNLIVFSLECTHASLIYYLGILA
jgi:hypothetical protein